MSELEGKYGRFSARERLAIIAQRASLAEMKDGPDTYFPFLNYVSDLFRSLDPQEPPGTPSLQNSLLISDQKAFALFLQVREASRQLLFDLLFALCCGGPCPVGGDFEDAHKYTLLLESLRHTRRGRITALYIAQQENPEDHRFLHKFENELNNARRRTTKPDLTRQALVLAVHWVDPRCPLWMMSNSVLKRVLTRISQGLSWTLDSIRHRLAELKPQGLLRAPKPLISDVRFSSRQNVITGFRLVSKGLTEDIGQPNSGTA